MIELSDKKEIVWPIAKLRQGYEELLNHFFPKMHGEKIAADSRAFAANVVAALKWSKLIEESRRDGLSNKEILEKLGENDKARDLLKLLFSAEEHFKKKSDK